MYMYTHDEIGKGWLNEYRLLLKIKKNTQWVIYRRPLSIHSKFKLQHYMSIE